MSIAFPQPPEEPSNEPGEPKELSEDTLPEPLASAEVINARRGARLDPTRAKLAWALMFAVAAIVLISGLSVFVVPDRWPLIKEWLQIVFGPVLTLTAAATGYFFGGRDST